MQKTKASTISITLSCFTLLFFIEYTFANNTKRPNVILIVSDDQGYGDLGLLDPNVQTPHLDQLAQEGIRLTQFYVTWPACTPSRGSILTGRYPQRNGTFDMYRNEAPDFGYLYKNREEYEISFEFIGGMDTREILIPKYLKNADYTSGIFGKWDLGSLKRYLPLQRGFDNFYGFVNSSIDYFTHERYGMHAMYRDNQATDIDKGLYSTDLFKREAKNFIKEHHEKPFFLYLPFNAPHTSSNLDPLIRSAPQALQKDQDKFPHLKEKSKTITKYSSKYKKEVQVANKEMKRLLYLASILNMDEAIGSIIDLLDEFKIRKNTLIIFFSDNGGGSGSNNLPLRGKKGNMFEGGIRVPAIISYPAKLPKNKICDEFLSTLEILPTILSVTGSQKNINTPLDGFDMIPVLKSESKSSRDTMFWKRRDQSALRYGKWKWINLAGQEHLYDLSLDISEKNNLIDLHPNIANDCRKKYKEWLNEMNKSEPRGPFKNY